MNFHSVVHLVFCARAQAKLAMTVQHHNEAATDRFVRKRNNLAKVVSTLLPPFCTLSRVLSLSLAVCCAVEQIANHQRKMADLNARLEEMSAAMERIEVSNPSSHNSSLR